VLEAASAGADIEQRFAIRSSRSCHVFLPTTHQVHVLFGLSRHEFALEQDAWRIVRRVTQLQNDYIPTMVDVYCL
jgi:3-phenylpropionate/cinnamic acid dioxygenase small subunit